MQPDTQPTPSVPRRVYAALAVVEEMISRALLVILVIVVFFYIVARSYLSSVVSVSWANELGGLLLIWLVFFGSAICDRENLHLRVDIVIGLLPRRVQQIVLALSDLISGLFLVIVIWQAIQIVQRDWSNSMLSLPLPLSAIQLGMLVGAVLMLLHIILRRVMPPSRATPETLTEV